LRLSCPEIASLTHARLRDAGPVHAVWYRAFATVATRPATPIPTEKNACSIGSLIEFHYPGGILTIAPVSRPRGDRVCTLTAGGTSDVGSGAANTVEEVAGPRIIIGRMIGGGITICDGSDAQLRTAIFLANYATVVNAVSMNGHRSNRQDFRPILALLNLKHARRPDQPSGKSGSNVALAKKARRVVVRPEVPGPPVTTLGELIAEPAAPRARLRRGAGCHRLVAGRVDMMFTGIIPTKPHLEAGTLRALAVTSKMRMPEVPDAPTMAEAGYPDVNTDFVWFGLAAPAKTPDATIKNLHARFTKAMDSKPLQAKLAAQGVFLISSKPTGSSRGSKPTREVRLLIKTSAPATSAGPSGDLTPGVLPEPGSGRGHDLNVPGPKFMAARLPKCRTNADSPGVLQLTGSGQIRPQVVC
jgi:hypothetical protein